MHDVTMNDMYAMIMMGIAYLIVRDNDTKGYWNWAYMIVYVMTSVVAILI